MAKNNLELADFCRQMIGSVYWFGTYGQVSNAKILSECAKRYPNQFSQKRINTAKDRGDFGKRCMDCSGLIKNYLMTKAFTPGSMPMPPTYNQSFDLSANSFHTKAAEKGSIDSMPEIIGLGLWKNNHVGVYIGNGKCIEAKGFDYGVVESDVANTAFVEWFKIPFIDYVDGSIPDAPVESPSVAKKSHEEIADEVIRGDWGNGQERKDRLTAAGYDYDMIQSIVNAKMGASQASEPVSNDWIGIVATQKDPLRVRSSKSTANTNNVIRLLPKGSEVMITGGEDGGWFALADGSGYVASKFIVRK